ncbi:hypothetical protein OC834_003909 [Tilletia horrida]|nr:hypothetical protein OC834_003909 [Tilletia horrida]KAK0555923.1 hypothetical protein OC844_005988 [Tilletia horrida]
MPGCAFRRRKTSSCAFANRSHYGFGDMLRKKDAKAYFAKRKPYGGNLTDGDFKKGEELGILRPAFLPPNQVFYVFGHLEAYSSSKEKIHKIVQECKADDKREKEERKAARAAAAAAKLAKKTAAPAGKPKAKTATATTAVLLAPSPSSSPSSSSSRMYSSSSSPSTSKTAPRTKRARKQPLEARQSAQQLLADEDALLGAMDRDLTGFAGVLSEDEDWDPSSSQ